MTFPQDWRSQPLWSLFRREKLVGYPNEQMLSVFREYGVIRKDSRKNLNQTAEDRSIYQLVEPGWLVVNRMKAWQGSVGVAFERGTVSGHYLCFRPTHHESSEYLNYLLRSEQFTEAFARLSRGVRPGQAEIDNDLLRLTRVPLPPLELQHSIASFLDDQVGVLDSLAKAYAQELNNIDLVRRARIIALVSPPRVPKQRAARVVNIRLGRQRAPEHEVGEHMLPYLRSANVRDGQIMLDDVKTMNFTMGEQSIYRLAAGDVLVTEASASAEAVGAAAVWHGDLPGVVCFQNTLLRLRPRGPSLQPEFLGWWARASHAAGAMRDYAAGANILHLGVEGLAALPFPSHSVGRQVEVAAACEEVDATCRALNASVQRSLALVAERKRALITACVTGGFDVTAASGRAAEAALHGIA